MPKRRIKDIPKEEMDRIVLALDQFLPEADRPKRRGRGQPKASAAPKVDLSDLAEPAPEPADTWLPEEVVLFWQHTVCTRCGQTYDGPRYNQVTEFVKMRAKGKSKRSYFPLHSVDAYEDLPRTMELRESRISTCRECFDYRINLQPVDDATEICDGDASSLEQATRAHYRALLEGAYDYEQDGKPMLRRPEASAHDAQVREAREIVMNRTNLPYLMRRNAG